MRINFDAICRACLTQRQIQKSIKFVLFSVSDRKDEKLIKKCKTTRRLL